MSQAPSQTPLNAGPDDDPIAHLHKMSTTAGLGSGDYVAVNAMAVAAGLAGVASSLALADNVLLVIPLVGIVLGIVALVQISHSNGTQTGRGLAWVGMVLCVGFASLMVVKSVRETIQMSEDRRQIGALVTSFGELARDGKADAAYELFSGKFKDRVKIEEFRHTLTSMRDGPLYGKFGGTSWTERANFFIDETSGDTGARAIVQLKFATESIPDEVIFRKVDGAWKIEGMQKVFPPPGVDPSKAAK